MENVKSVKKSYPVLEMMCASCAGSAQSILEMQEGVLHAEVNYADKSANIEFLPQVTTPETLKKALQEVGYDLLIDESAEAGKNLAELQEKQLKRLFYNTLGAMALAVPLIVIGMFFMHEKWANLSMWALATPILFGFGSRFFVGAFKQTRNGRANMDTLVALSTSVAYIFSVFNLLFPAFWHRGGLHGHVYFEAAGAIIAFILLGKYLEERAKSNTASALQKLIGLQANTVNKINVGDNSITEIALVQVQLGDILLVKSGERIPVDGAVTAGNSFVDESMMSGEPIAIEKKINDLVLAGTVNQKGSLHIRAEKVGEKTMLAQIIRRVKEAQGSKAPVQVLADHIASIFVPVVIAIALLSAVAWLIWGGENGTFLALHAFITVLVIACPCALGLATPTAIMVGIGKGATHGILIKNAESLELAKQLNTIVLDKTGTITEGKPRVHEMTWASQQAETQTAILRAIEQQSEHPLAEAIVSHLKTTTSTHITDFESLTGLGAKAQYQEKTYFVGNLALLQQHGITINESLRAAADKALHETKTLVYFADAQQTLAVISIADSIKLQSAEAVKKLHDMGVEVYMLTGDNAAVAKNIAEKVGIKHFKAEVLPIDKAQFIKELQQKGKIVGMVGDGINDSSALAQANVSIAMGKGSDIAIEVAQMTIISGDLNKVAQAIELSKQTVRTIQQNLFWAFFYNLIGIPVAAGLLYPFNGFLLNPMLAGAAMALSSVSVVSNSLLLKAKKI